MAVTQDPVDVHWNYLLALEEDVERLSRYVEFVDKNFACFSIEIARILMSAAAEVDVVCKQICDVVSPQSKARNIEDYRSIIVPAYPRFSQLVVEWPRYGLALTPWENWQSGRVPLWWTGYNNTKHHRHTHYDSAHLENALRAVSGLFVATLYLYREKAEAAELTPKPKLFKAGSGFLIGGGATVPGYGGYYRL
jgi:hypothetical protein